ncbi:MAG: hypothetical protein JWQ04_3277 [Pedosphaera sp.]|nr:hypothetical protein [Pedosphaera sp.]
MQGSGLPLVLVRSNLPASMRAIEDFAGSPAGNRVGLALLAESVRQTLGLPDKSVMPCGEIHTGFVWVECGTIPPAHAIAEILTLLQGVGLADYFAILLLDLREKFFRPYHQGRNAGDYQPLTQEQVALEAESFLRETEQRLAAFKKFLGSDEAAPENAS